MRRRNLFRAAAWTCAGLAIAAFMGVFVVPEALWWRRHRHDGATAHLLSQVAMALEQYKSMQGAYPPAGVRPMLKALTRPDKRGRRCWDPNPQNPDTLVDGWGREFVYRREAAGYALHSKGYDGRDDGGTGDDISVTR